MKHQYDSLLFDFLDSLNLKDGDNIGIDQYSPDKVNVVKLYTKAHINRFNTGIKMLMPYVKDNYTIHETGSPYPFFSYYYYLTKNCTVMCSDLYQRHWFYDERLFNITLNLCTTKPPIVDVNICSEVLEHLPCDLTMVFNNLLDTCKYLLISLPTGTVGKDFSFKEEVGDPLVAHEHLREFGARIKELIGDTKILDSKVIDTIAYQGMAIMVLEGKLFGETS